MYKLMNNAVCYKKFKTWETEDRRLVSNKNDYLR